jgi:YidC/Oxa1 family membrane protein insertase
MTSLYHAVIFNPLYNGLIGLFNLMPWIDAGIAVILLTVAVRLVLFPLSRKAVHTQIQMQKINPELAAIKEKYKDSQEQAKKTLELYKEKGVNPFSGVLVLIIQLPIIFALYRIFLYAGFPNVNVALLYSFVHAPMHINVEFLGLIDITQKSILLALLAAVSSFFQLKLAVPAPAPTVAGSTKSFGDNLAQSMQTQMKYFFPILVFFISYKISGVVALYWLTSNLFTIGQEIVVRRKLTEPKTKTIVA